MQVDHSNGVKSYYYHLGSFAGSFPRWVDENSVLGYVGHTGYVDPCSFNHLHFEVRVNGMRTDPGQLKACIGSHLISYPAEITTGSWPNVPVWSQVHSDGTGCGVASISVTPEPDMNLSDTNATVTYSGIYVNPAYAQLVGILQCTSSYITTSSWLNDCSLVGLGPPPSGSITVQVFQQFNGRDCRNRDTCWLIVTSNFGGDDLVPQDQAAHMLSPDGPASTYPTANAGPDQIVGSGATLSLDGSGSSDPNSRPLTYSWVQVAGTNAVLDDPTKVRPTVKAPKGPTTLSFQLTVTNSLGQSRHDYMFVTVKSPK